MCLAASKEFIQIEEWLKILTSTYANHPDIALAQTINYYLQRLIRHDDFTLDGSKQCDYLYMSKYWQWLSTANNK